MKDQSRGDAANDPGPADADSGDAVHVDPRSAKTRKAFLDAGWALLNELRLSEIFGALNVDVIAGRAGRSERSFWNHFPDWQSYVDALIADIPRLRDLRESENWLPIQVVRDLLEGSERDVLPELLEQATRDNWDAIHRPEEKAGFVRQLLLLSRVHTEPGLGEVLFRDYWGMHHGRYTAIYEATGEMLGMEPIPPLTWARFARLLTALIEGMELVSVCTQGSEVPEDLPAAMSALGLVLLRPVGSGETIDSRRALLLARSDAPLSETGHSTDLVACSRTAVEMLEHSDGPLWNLTTAPGWPHDLWEALATVTGEPHLTLRDRLQRPEMVGALAFGTHLPLGVSRRPNAENWKLTLAVDWSSALARAARHDPWCAHGLLSERLRHGETGERLKRFVNPGAELAELLGGPRRSVHDRSVNIVLTAALSDDSASPAEIAQATVSRIPGLTNEPT